MKLTREEFIKIRIASILNKDSDKYVFLRKDSRGFYIKYAFKNGVPHDNRCLSWYDSYQEGAYIRNGWVKGNSDKRDLEYLNAIKEKREKRVGELFVLSSFTCGFEEYPKERLEESEKSWKEYHDDEPFIPSDHICRVGCPAKICRDTQCNNWTYKEPVKCACWVLNEPTVPTQVMIPIELAIKLYEQKLI